MQEQRIDTGTDRDGLEVVKIDTGEVVHFVPCSYDDRMRERVIAGMLINMRNDCFVRDTRHT